MRVFLIPVATALVAVVSLASAAQVQGAYFVRLGEQHVWDAKYGFSWDLSELKHQPYRLVKTEYTRDGRQLRSVIEFTRALTPEEKMTWRAPGFAPLAFYLMDRDDVPLAIYRAKREGEVLGRPGNRLRLILTLPPKKLLEQTAEIIVQPVSYAFP